MAKIEFEFTSPLTTMRKEAGTNRIRPEHQGDFYAKGVAEYKPCEQKEHRISYTLTEYSFKTGLTPSELPITQWIGGSMITLEDAHDLIIHHIEKLLCLDTEPVSPYRVHDYDRESRGGTFKLFYTDTKGKECEHGISEVEFGKWLSYSGRTASVVTYWTTASIQQKKRDFSKYLCDLMDFESGSVQEYQEHIGTL